MFEERENFLRPASRVFNDALLRGWCEFVMHMLLLNDVLAGFSRVYYSIFPIVLEQVMTSEVQLKQDITVGGSVSWSLYLMLE